MGEEAARTEATDPQRETAPAERDPEPNPSAQLGDVLDRMAHALREPLVAANGFARMLAREGGEVPEPQLMGRRILEAVEIMQRRVDEALAYTFASDDPLRFEQISIREVVEVQLSMLAAGGFEIAGRVEVGELPSVRGDGPALGTVFGTLLELALTPALGTENAVRVVAERSGEEWEFAVGGDTPLIGVDESGDVFELFGRWVGPGEWSSDLAICARLVERHGGRIWSGRTGWKGAIGLSLPA